MSSKIKTAKANAIIKKNEGTFMNENKIHTIIEAILEWWKDNRFDVNEVFEGEYTEEYNRFDREPKFVKLAKDWKKKYKNFSNQIKLEKECYDKGFQASKERSKHPEHDRCETCVEVTTNKILDETYNKTKNLIIELLEDIAKIIQDERQKVKESKLTYQEQLAAIYSLDDVALKIEELKKND